MKTSLLVLDPKGDTELILRRPNLDKHKESNQEEPAVKSDSAAVEADSPETVDGKPPTDKTVIDVFCDRSASIHELADVHGLKPYDENSQPVEIRFRVSSAHLILASPVFKAMLDGPFSETVRNERGLYEIKAFEWNAEALLILLDIIHGHHRSAPKAVDLNMLEQIALLVDYYQCHEIVEVFADKWVAAHRDAIPQEYSKSCLSWMFVAWVFSANDLFNSMVSVSVKHSRSPVQTNLPIPNTILEKVESRRQSLIDQIIDNLYGMLESLWATTDGCRAECSCMLLGSLMKQMREGGFEIPKPAGRIAQEKSVVEWRRFVSGLNSPIWRLLGIPLKHECSFKDKTQPWMDDMGRTFMNGIRFENFHTTKSSPNKVSSPEAQ
ncbi:hypothetical protein MRS44_003691 [Fusarium solani]|uniref:BTB domain-containing protein n=1 Tax=Fusarium solani TaxID=169388 RepID=A0A9P9L2T0_FUSSL|nr:uncharacterized protein B0J15DRAFT_521962 [Fusarium solani]KAH7273193.1 hypothetical protein B0J15DRAFT_521962 [Fusarium solani]KAJ3469626.1 hypothetical protein MRS44_003691 [Fusarium solani]KAJ4208897.1 hypothetical protein NW759_013498 [Fusarium solani]